MAHDIGLLLGSKAKAENTTEKGESLPLSSKAEKARSRIFTARQ